jgi:nitrate reductase NapD
MNVSSVVVKTSAENLKSVMEKLRSSALCDIFFHDDHGKIIVTIEGESISDEMRKMKEIMGIPGVLCADLAYSYSGKETEEALQRLLKTANPVPDALKDVL